METGVGPGKWWKMNQMVTTSLTRVHDSGLYTQCHCLLLDSVWHTSITIKLQLLEIFGKSYG